MERRIARLEALWRRADRDEAGPAYDLSRLTAAERAEFEELARRCRDHATRDDPGGFGALDDAALERLATFGALAHMPRRDRF